MKKGRIECGCDEAGRGCLAGPVVAAAVILPAGYNNALLQDSKKLSPKMRSHIRGIIEREALAWGVGVVSNTIIDEINILQASVLAMHKAIEKLYITPEFLLIDGNYFKKLRDIPYECIIKGDGKYASIAAASILAKTFRDELMESMHFAHPVYEWKKNKGYPTPDHIKAIKEYGFSIEHRNSFHIKAFQAKLDFQ